MPIYQRPIENIGITKTFSGTITDSGSTAIEGAVVALKRRGSGAILYADTDASGNYSFNIDADGDFQIEYSLSKDSSVRTTTEELAPANPLSWYTGDGASALYACVLIENFSTSGGSSASYYLGTPTAQFVDAGPHSLLNARDTYGFTGPGTGATVEIEMTEVGEHYQSFSSRLQLTELFGGVAKPLKRYNITSFGRRYQSPYLKVSGIAVGLSNQSLQFLLDNGYDAFVYNNCNYYREQVNVYYPVSGRQLELGLNQLDSVWGSDRSLWGTYTNDYTGGKFSVALPGEQDKSNFDSSSTISAADAELISIIRDDEVYSVNNHQFQIYGKVIYTGVSGIDNNGVFTGQGEDSAVAAYPSKITLKELDILKGYFGRYGLIEGILPVGQTTTAAISNFFNFGYQMIQGISSGVSGQYSADSPNNWMYETNGGNKSTLFTAVAKEFRSFLRQKSGVDIPESAFGITIYPILQKAGITFRYVGAGSQRQKWTFTSNGIVKVSDPE